MDDWGQHCDISVYNIDHIINSRENPSIRRNIKINEKDENIDEFVIVKSLFKSTFDILCYVTKIIYKK